MKKTNRVLALLLASVLLTSALSVMSSCSSNGGAEQTRNTHSEGISSSVQTNGKEINEPSENVLTYDGVWLFGYGGRVLLAISGENCEFYVWDLENDCILTQEEIINKKLVDDTIPSYSTIRMQYLENIKLDLETGILSAITWDYTFHGDTRILDKQIADENFSATIKLESTNHAVMGEGLNVDGTIDLMRVADSAEELENLKIISSPNGYWRASSQNEEILIYDDYNCVLIPIEGKGVGKQSETGYFRNDDGFLYYYTDDVAYMCYKYYFLSNGRLIIIKIVDDFFQASVYNYNLTNGKLTIEGLTKALELSIFNKITYTYQGECPFEPDWGNAE